VDLLPPLELKGKEQAVTAYRLIEVLPEVLPHRLDSPMVGRSRERRRLQNAFETGDFPARKSGLCKRHCPVTLRILWAVTS
jgi:hypothetical protein